MIRAFVQPPTALDYVVVVGVSHAPSFPEVGQIVRSPRGWGYAVRAHIGGGHFGAVFDCHGPFDQPFALKVLMPANRPYAQVRREWLEEARRLWQLRHPNIVYVHDYFEREGLFYLVLERCDHSLEDMLGQPLTDRLVIQLSRQLLFAMQYLIDHEIVHNDIHAGNILIVHGKEPVPKFSDFGIAQDLYGRSGVRPPIVNNRIMAPEVALGGYSTAQSDLYQLGLLMFGMYTGQPPLDLEAGYDEVIRQIRDGVPRRRAEALGTPLGNVISILLRRHEQYRFNSPAQVWDELRKLDAWTVSTTTQAGLLPPPAAESEADSGPLSQRPVARQSGLTQRSMPAVRLPEETALASSPVSGLPPTPRTEQSDPRAAEAPSGRGHTWRPPEVQDAPQTPRELPPPTPRDPALSQPNQAALDATRAAYTSPPDTSPATPRTLEVDEPAPLTPRID